MKQLGNCVFLDEKKLEFKFFESDYVIKKINQSRNTFLLEGFENYIPITNFFNLKEFYEFAYSFHPEFFI